MGIVYNKGCLHSGTFHIEYWIWLCIFICLRMRFSLSSQEIAGYLNGFLCVYKQKDVSLASLKKNLMKRIATTVSSLEPPPIPMIERPIVEPHEESGALLVVGIRKQLDYT